MARPEIFGHDFIVFPTCPVLHAIPYRISVAQQIPLRFQDQANKTIKHVLDSKIIAKCDTPSAWCSPGFFVVKGDGKSVRLVTDYTKLNLHIDRPVHPFPSVIDILQSFPSTAQIFAKFDAVNGYFQIPLDQQSSALITFILPSGRYRYLHIPQGLNVRPMNGAGDQMLLLSLIHI